MNAENATRILLENDRRVRAVMKGLRESIAAAADQQQRAEDALDLDASFEKKNGVVTMDRLQVAIHLMTAQIMFHVVPEHWKTMLAGVISNYVTRVGLKAAATRAAQKIPGAGTMIAIFQGAFSIPSRLLIQAKMERDIRKVCADVRKQMNETILAKTRKRTRVQDVHTRHFRPRFVRRWKECKSK